MGVLVGGFEGDSVKFGQQGVGEVGSKGVDEVGAGPGVVGFLLDLLVCVLVLG